MSHMSELSIDKQNEDGDHHPLGPSALKYIELCPGYSSAPGTRAAAEEGTKMHLAVETDNLEGLTDEQAAQCRKVLEYVGRLRKDASEVIKEKRLVIRYA